MDGAEHSEQPPASPLERLSRQTRVYGDAGVINVWILANDPRWSPVEGVLVALPDHGDIDLADLEDLHQELREEYGWSSGYSVDLKKSGGGIGASGMEITTLVLGVIGAVPVARDIYQKLSHRSIEIGTKEEAWEVATWAVALQYPSVSRPNLRRVRVARHPAHWEFEMTLDGAADRFQADVSGTRETAVATRVVWIGGDAMSTPGVQL